MLERLAQRERHRGRGSRRVAYKLRAGCGLSVEERKVQGNRTRMSYWFSRMVMPRRLERTSGRDQSWLTA